MKIKINNLKKKGLVVYILLILLFRLILATGLRVWAFGDNQYDDGMMIKNAANLIGGNWLGKYDQYIFAKGITFPLYLDIIHMIGLPFIFANVLMCFVASLTFIIVIKKIIPNINALAIIYTVLMFNPIASDSWTLQRVYRDSIYSYLVVILFSLIIAIYLNRRTSSSKLLCFSLGAGFFLSAVWLAREDSPWVSPFVAVALIVTAVLIFLDKNLEIKIRLKKILSLTVIPIFLIISILTVSTINYTHYGVFMTNEYTGGYLPELFKELTIIKPDKWMPQVPIPRSTREKAYKVSPTFAKLKNTLENHAFVATTPGGNASCSMLAWAVIDSTQWYGLKDARSSQEFYKKSSEEIKAAIKSGKLKTRGGYIFMFESPWNNSYIKPLIRSLGETLRMTIHMSKYENKPLSNLNISSFGTDSQTRQLEYITNNIAYNKEDVIPKRQTKVAISNKISLIYYELNPYLFLIGLIGYVYITLRFLLSIRKKKYFLADEWLITTGIFLSYLLRLLLISYTDVCSIFMQYSMYLAPSYWLILMFTFTSIFISMRDFVKNYYYNKKASHKN
ncbi:membrane protein [Clostridium acetobutylicum EA 2018]|uniref:hypothetical protein n=1 Tax=Clostridium acetobutylicum TaxID=1488 RepID=UPI000200A72C|nr:hypothetical protein [Clostridium acetobutylicum]ADZ20017.1 membrane protein [Clostridium acetobutylicum EA 2018]